MRAPRRLDPDRVVGQLPSLYRAARAWTSSREEAEDLVQETCARVLARPRLLTGEDELGYLLRALRNTLISQRRAEPPAPGDDRAGRGARARDAFQRRPRRGGREQSGLRRRLRSCRSSFATRSWPWISRALIPGGGACAQFPQGTLTSRLFRARDRAGDAGSRGASRGAAARDRAASRRAPLSRWRERAARPEARRPEDAGVAAAAPGDRGTVVQMQRLVLDVVDGRVCPTDGRGSAGPRRSRSRSAGSPSRNRPPSPRARRRCRDARRRRSSRTARQSRGTRHRRTSSPACGPAAGEAAPARCQPGQHSQLRGLGYRGPPARASTTTTATAAATSPPAVASPSPGVRRRRRRPRAGRTPPSRHGLLHEAGTASWPARGLRPLQPLPLEQLLPLGRSRDPGLDPRAPGGGKRPVGERAEVCHLPVFRSDLTSLTASYIAPLWSFTPVAPPPFSSRSGRPAKLPPGTKRADGCTSSETFAVMIAAR